MPALDVLDEILDLKKIRLTSRAKRLLTLILDGLLNEPFHHNSTIGHAKRPGEAFPDRIEVYNTEVRRLPQILEGIARDNQAADRDQEGYQFITLFDLLHNFEAKFGPARVQFFPGKL